MSNYGPAKTLLDSLGKRREELHNAWIKSFEDNGRARNEIVHDREWLLVQGVKR